MNRAFIVLFRVDVNISVYRRGGVMVKIVSTERRIKASFMVEVILSYNMIENLCHLFKNDEINEILRHTICCVFVKNNEKRLPIICAILRKMMIIKE